MYVITHSSTIGFMIVNVSNKPMITIPTQYSIWIRHNNIPYKIKEIVWFNESFYGILFKSESLDETLKFAKTL